MIALYVLPLIPIAQNVTDANRSSQIAEVNREASIAKSNAEAYAKDAKAEALKAVDKFDHTVEEKAAKAKGGISSWFGGSK